MKRTIPTLFLIFFAFGVSTMSDQDYQNAHNEVEDHPYVLVDKSVMPRQKAYSFRGQNFFTTQVNVDSNGMDIIGDAANEPSLAVDPTNPDRIVMGWRQFDNINSNFRQAGYGFSLDGGATFTFPGVIEPGVFRSDPVLDFDAAGNFYYNSLQTTFACDVFKITDGGTTWSNAFPAKGGDKQWMRVDRRGGIGNPHNYSYWNSSFSTCPGQFTRSTDGSSTFEDCIDVDGNPFWGTLTIDNLGVLYITGRNGSGEILMIQSQNAQNASEAIVWDSVTTVDLNGELDFFFPLNPQGLMGQAWIDVDVSTSASEGTIYVLASVVNNDDPADVMLARSTNGGVSFEAPIRVNTDPLGNYNWFGTMSVAPNGRIDVIWLDTRNDPNNEESVLYFTFSQDQGDTWNEAIPLSIPFDSRIGWPQQQKMGDYFDMKSDNNFAHIAWANTINGGQDVYYTQVDLNSILSTQAFAFSNVDFQIVPNPASDSFQIATTSLAPGNLSIIVYDTVGKKVATLYNDTAEGNFSKTFNRNDAIFKNIQSGLYFVTLEGNNFSKTKKLILK